MFVKNLSQKCCSFVNFAFDLTILHELAAADPRRHPDGEGTNPKARNFPLLWSACRVRPYLETSEDVGKDVRKSFSSVQVTNLPDSETRKLIWPREQVPTTPCEGLISTEIHSLEICLNNTLL